MSTLGKYNRNISITGVGCTLFMCTVGHPEMDGFIEGELFGCAALKVMEDTGVNPRDADFHFHGETSPFNGSNYLTLNVQVTSWFGMKGKGSTHHSEACYTGYLVTEQAVNAVASEKYNCVLTGAVELGDSAPSPADNVESLKYPYKRDKMAMEKFLKTMSWLHDHIYTRNLMAGQKLIYDDVAEWYVWTRGATAGQMNDALNWMCINNRRNAPVNSPSLERRIYKSLAEEMGMTLDEYMNSPYNSKMEDYLRAGGVELKYDDVAATIVCATEMVPVIAKNLKHRPTWVLGIGSAACEAITPHSEVYAIEETVRQVYELTGISGDDLDLLHANDFIITSHLISAEIVGYLPYGEGWKYICDGYTAWDGDKPINTNGGCTSFGHAHAALGLADVYKACKQLWGECGEHQVKKQPKTAMLRGYGGTQNIAAVLLCTIDQQEM